MSRRRSVDPAIPVSIAIPRSLHTRMNELLAYKQSRSKWVCQAIQAKLDAHDDAHQVISSLSSHRLAALLFNRNVINWELYDRIKSNLPIEETEVKQ